MALRRQLANVAHGCRPAMRGPCLTAPLPCSPSPLSSSSTSSSLCRLYFHFFSSPLFLGVTGFCDRTSPISMTGAASSSIDCTTPISLAAPSTLRKPRWQRHHWGEASEAREPSHTLVILAIETGSLLAVETCHGEETPAEKLSDVSHRVRHSRKSMPLACTAPPRPRAAGGVRACAAARGSDTRGGSCLWRMCAPQGAPCRRAGGRSG